MRVYPCGLCETITGIEAGTGSIGVDGRVPGTGDVDFQVFMAWGVGSDDTRVDDFERSHISEDSRSWGHGVLRIWSISGVCVGRVARDGVQGGNLIRASCTVRPSVTPGGRDAGVRRFFNLLHIW